MLLPLIHCHTHTGEQHGFRKAENIRRALEAELFFYSKVFGFTLDPIDDIKPVEIENLNNVPSESEPPKSAM